MSMSKDGLIKNLDGIREYLKDPYMNITAKRTMSEMQAFIQGYKACAEDVQELINQNFIRYLTDDDEIVSRKFLNGKGSK